MNLSSLLQSTDSSVSRMVDRLSLDASKKAYLDSVDAFMNLSRGVFRRQKSVDRHIEYFVEKHSQNMRDTHYVVRPQQINKSMGGIAKALEDDSVSTEMKALNSSLAARLAAMEKKREARNALIDRYAAEYKELRTSLIAQYHSECKEIQQQTQTEIAQMREKFKVMNACIPELTDKQLHAKNSFKVPKDNGQADSDKTALPNDTADTDEIADKCDDAP